MTAVGIASLLVEMVNVNDEEKKEIKKITGFNGMMTLLLLIATVLLPSKDTMIKMKVAQYVTSNNIQMVINLADELRNKTKRDVIDIIQKLKEGEIKESEHGR